MASPTFDFDDQLSEDWISQPRSSDGAASPGQINLRSSALHSRIPLPTKPTSANKLRSPAPQHSSKNPSPSPRPLHMKSKSEFNVPILKSLDTKSNGKPRRPPSASRSVSANHRRSSSAQSWTADGTVQHHGPEFRNGVASGQMTPEWKKRLLKAQDPTSDQKDLFSPIGLENVFRPPSAQKSSSAIQSPKRRNQVRPRAESSMIYPSSPPPYPSTRRRRSTIKSTSPSPLPQRHEHDHNQCLAKGGKCEGALKTPTPTRRQSRVRLSRSDGLSSAKGSSASKRIASGTSFAEHESMSPVTIQNGKIDYKSVQESALKYREKRTEMGLSEQKRPSSRSSENGLDYGTTQRRQAMIPEVTITSLLDQSVLESEGLAPKNAFVSMKRGGFSSDDNFHGRPLSPSSFQPDNTFLSEKSGFQSEQPHRPTTPSRDFAQSSPEKGRSGGSPLKLFGQHDTFTNNHLMRRLSQFNPPDNPNKAYTSEPPSPSPQRNVRSSPTSVPQNRGRISDFGAGVLDEHEFPPSESFLAEPLQEDDPSLPPVLPPSNPALFEMRKGRVSSLDPKRRVSRLAAKRLSHSQSAHRGVRRPSLAEFRRNIGEAVDLRNDGKRILYSPTKDHHSKRRRTLNSSVGSPGGSPEAPVYGLQIGKKRTDALPGEQARDASPDVLANRRMRQPQSRSVTPNSRRASTSTLSSWLGAASSRQVSEQMGIDDQGDPQTNMLANELASLAVKVMANANGDRKTSITTGDFQQQAHMIMRNLRGQPISPGTQTPGRRTPSARASGDVSFADQMSDIEELDEESIRSLRSLQKNRSIRSNYGSIINSLKSNAGTQERMANKLKQFKDNDDSGGLSLESSLKNLKIAPDHIPDQADLPDTDAPDIRILDRAINDVQQADSDVYTNVRTRSSTDVSVGRSIKTSGSSNNSRKYNIAPETVKDFLSDHVGRMRLDHSMGVWVRDKSGNAESRPGSAHMNSDGTEEDPLRSIPDLEEEPSTASLFSGSQSTTSRAGSTGTVITRSTAATSKPHPTIQPSLQTSQSSESRSRPNSGHGADSSQLSRFSKFGSSQAGPETRATSWSTAPPVKTQMVAVEPDLPQVQEVGETTEEQQIGEQAILEPAEDFGDSLIGTSEQPAPRFTSVAVSSPFSYLPDNVLFPPSTQKDTEHLPPSEQQTPVRRTRVSSALLRSKEKAKRHLSAVKQRHTARPVSRIDEQDEQTEERVLSQQDPETSLALVTPQIRRTQPSSSPLLPLPSSDRHPSVSFHRSIRLEPLSEFTIHQADESFHLDVDYVKKRHGLRTEAEIDGRFSIAVRELVARITDIEPFEPNWDYIRKLDLSHKNLVTLHALENFCERIEDLDVSHNELGQVNGVPETLTVLDISHNCLTSMTAWGHLMNLQYLNVSDNQIDSLVGFSALPHLRELRADGNQLTSLDGLKDTTGLLKLSLRDNAIAEADLSECDLPRLTELDLSGNQVSFVPGLENLSSLQIFRAAGNNFEGFASDALPSSLITLDLADNKLTTLDISHLMHLETLDVDCNSLSKIAGLGSVRGLETLSWRDQRLPRDCSIEFYEAVDVRHLALSGNKLDLSSFKTPFLNLNALEMASCGIEVLPTKFGRLMPNVRYLSLSHNAIKDIKPLVGIKKLQHLHLVENRIHRLRDTAAVLQKVGCELVSIDLRVNPLTLGFYPVQATPANTVRGRSTADLMVTHKRSDSNDSQLSAPIPSAAMIVKQVLQDQDRELNSTYKARLDEGTRLRRKVFELLVYNGCPVLEVINGLGIDDVTITEKDAEWRRLVELKVVRPKVVDVKEV